MTAPPTVRSLERRIKDHARDIGFDLVGITRVRGSEHAAFYRRWLDEGRHGEMAYLGRPDAVRRRLSPDRAWPALRSAIVVTDGYAARAGAGSGAGAGVIARYARGRDYHKVVKKKLVRLLQAIEGEVGGELPAARAYVDTGPVLERELARRAGLGWFGRNTMLINPGRGSYFFLGALLVELELEPDAPFTADRCGTCTRCVDACPTGALLGRDADGAPVMDATRCISYLTIEQRGPIPRELRPLIGNRIYGCDICQEVCPWNSSKVGSSGGDAEFVARPGGGGRGGGGTATEVAEISGTEAPALVELMGMSREEWDVFTRGTAMRRAGYAGFKRNVAVALGNWGTSEAVPVLVSALRDNEPLVRGHAAWALGRVGLAAARDALASALASEPDPIVRQELELALGDVPNPRAPRASPASPRRAAARARGP